jgi:hypothetical protein
VRWRHTATVTTRSRAHILQSGLSTDAVRKELRRTGALPVLALPDEAIQEKSCLIMYSSLLLRGGTCSTVGIS